MWVQRKLIRSKAYFVRMENLLIPRLLLGYVFLFQEKKYIYLFLVFLELWAEQLANLLTKDFDGKMWTQKKTLVNQILKIYPC